MTDKEKIVDKIRKLLAFSESSNKHEAMLAMENANKLLMKHNLEMSDVSEVDLNEMIEDDIMSGGRLMSYKTSLITSIMKLNNCEVVVHNRIRGQKIVKALGKKHNIQVSTSMYEYLVSTMERIIKKEKCEDANSFRVGFAQSINQKVNEIIKERNKKQNEFDEACTALVIVEKALVKKFMEEKYPNIKTTITKSSIADQASYLAGRTAGQAVSLNNQIR